MKRLVIFTVYTCISVQYKVLGQGQGQKNDFLTAVLFEVQILLNY